MPQCYKWLIKESWSPGAPFGLRPNRSPDSTNAKSFSKLALDEADKGSFKQQLETTVHVLQHHGVTLKNADVMSLCKVLTSAFLSCLYEKVRPYSTFIFCCKEDIS